MPPTISSNLTMLRNLLELSTSDDTKPKRYDSYLPVRELDLKDPHATNHNQPIATGIEDVQAIVPHSSIVGTVPCGASEEKNQGRSIAAHEVRAMPSHTTSTFMDSIRCRKMSSLSKLFETQNRTYRLSSLFLVQWELLLMQSHLQPLRWPS